MMYSGCPIPYMPSHGLPYPPAHANFYPLIGYPPADSLNTPGTLSSAFSGTVPSAYPQPNLGLSRPMPLPHPVGYHPGQGLPPHNPLSMNMSMFPYRQFKEEAIASPRLPAAVANVLPESENLSANESEKLANSAARKAFIHSKTKKKSSQSENKKRKEFSELARARTEKLMNDGLNFKYNSEASSVSTPQSNTPNITSDVENKQDTIRNNVMEDALSQLKIKLMHSDKIISILRAKQKSVENQKRSSELFSVQLAQSKT